MEPWFITTERFGPASGEVWHKYVAWSGLTHLAEVVSLDPMLCPRVLGELRDDYWPHIVNEDFMLDFFVDVDFMVAQLSAVETRNILCVFRNPSAQPVAPRIWRTSSSWDTTLSMSRDPPARSRTVADFRMSSTIPSFPLAD